MGKTAISKIEKYLLISCFIISGIAILGWVLNIPILVSVLPGSATIKFNTALLGLFLSTSLIISHLNNPAYKWVNSIFQLFIFAIALFSFLEYYFPFNFSIDNLFVQDQISHIISGRMSPATSISFLLTAAGNIISTKYPNKQLSKVYYVLVFSVLIIALISLVSFFLFIPVENKALFIQTMSLPTTLLFLSFSIILMFRKPSVSFKRIMNFKSLGSKVFWKFCPIVIIVPILVSYLLLYIFDAIGVNIDFGIALSTNIFILLSFTHLIYLSIELNNSERLKLILEQQIGVLKENEIRRSLLQETHHRVKNNFQIVNSVLGLQANKSENVELKSIISDCQSRIRAIATLHESIYLNGDFKVVKLSFFLKSIVSNIIGITERQKKINLEFDVPDIDMNMKFAMPLGLIVNEIVTNSLKHGFTETVRGTIFLKLESIGENHYKFIVGDDGKGCSHMAKELMNPSHMGSELITVFTEQLNGEISILENEGLVYQLVFKLD